jgi:tyrosinase
VAFSFADGKQFNQWSTTLRWPSGSDANAFSQNYYVDQAFANGRQGLSDGLYALFSASHDYSSFSDTGVSGPGGASSLESIHNNVHGICGGNSPGQQAGDMSYLDYAAFDPLFWLHHT